MLREADFYAINVIFRGLFLVWVGDRSISVYLPNLQDPGVSELHPKARLRAHAGVLEFPTRHWSDKRAHQDVLIVDKPNKESVALCWLDGHRIRLSSRQGSLRTPTVSSDFASLCNQKYTMAQGADLLIVDDDPRFAVQELARFRGQLSQNLSPGDDWVGYIEFTNGVVRSERRSVAEVSPIEWIEVEPKDAREALDDDKGVLLKTLMAKYPKRLLNLDLRVTLVAAEGDSLIVDLLEETAVHRTFVLGPSESGNDVNLWIKNRELNAILRDSDRLDDTATGCPRAKIDIDHEAYSLLAQKGVASITIPILAREGDSDGGCGCGGSCGGGSGG